MTELTEEKYKCGKCGKIKRLVKARGKAWLCQECYNQMIDARRVKREVLRELNKIAREMKVEKMRKKKHQYPTSLSELMRAMQKPEKKGRMKVWKPTDEDVATLSPEEWEEKKKQVRE
mgnify:CR=1 FL=1